MTMTPVDVEQRLTFLVTEMTKAQRNLAAARDSETETEIALKRARIGAFHSGDCPQVTRGGYTVADRDAWIDQKVIQQWEAHRIAVNVREIAQDHLRMLYAQAETVRSLGASVRTAYTLAGA